MRLIEKKGKRTIVSILLVAAILICTGYFPTNVYATNSTGRITREYVAIRDRAGTQGTTVQCYVYTGQQLEILGDTYVDGKKWYNVNLTVNSTAYTGWVYGDYVSVNQQVDGSYVDSLVAAGFPASYANQLAQLHNNYPSWTFEAVQTGLDWNDVIQKESVIGKNLIHNSYNDARKSTEAGAYDWNTNKWAAYDGTTWVAANSKYIAYCMDPRNFLTDTYIFMFESLSYSSTQNADGVSAIIGNSFMKDNVTDTDGTTINYANTLVDVGSKLQISPYHLATRIRQEQGDGKSVLISGTYPGYEGLFNYFNVGAFSTAGGSIAENGLTTARNKGWNSRYKSIYGGAELLASKYIAVGQDTLYFQKFNVVNKSSLYAHQYMTNVMAAMSEAKIAATGYKDKNQGFHFKIPVYANMPENACTFADNGNPNNYLKSLSVSGLSLTPAFSGSRTSYSLVVGSDVKSVSISATPVASTSKVSGTGTFDLSNGNNTFTINCKAQNGDVKAYTILVSKSAGTGNTNSNTNNNANVDNNPNQNTDQAATGQDYSISSSKISIGEVVSGIQPGTNAAGLLESISATGCTLKVLKQDGSENSDLVATGNKLAVYVNGTAVKTYDIVIYGDVNGDGKITMSDLVKINRHLLGIEILNGVYAAAGDTNRKNDGITMSDLVIINRTMLGLATITQ